MQNLRKNKNTPRSFLTPTKRIVPNLRLLGSTTSRRQQPLRASTLLSSPGEGHHARLGEYAAYLYKEKAMTDVMIVVQTQEFKSHKAVLACYSPYFKEVLIKPGFNEIHYLQIPSVTARAFEILLEYMYTGKLKVNCQELSEVYRAARRLGMKGALDKCIELLHVTSEHFENMVYLYVTARNLNLLEASVRAFRLMTLHFEKLVTTQEFLDLEISQIVELFNTDEVGARGEVILYLAALKWLNYKYLEREQHILTVFNCIRFALMNMEEILACYHPPVLPGLVLIPEIRQALLNATCYVAAKSVGQENLFSELAPTQRKFLFAGEPVVLWDVTIFDPEKFYVTKRYNAAVKIQSLFRGYISRKKLREDLYIANYAATVIQSVYRAYCVRKTLKMRKSVIQTSRKGIKLSGSKKERSGFLSTFGKRKIELLGLDIPPVVPTGEIYLMGAFDATKGDKGQNTIFTFETENQVYNSITKCPQPRHDSRIVVLGDYLYVLGGYNPLEKISTGGMHPLNECFQYEIVTAKWSPLPRMHHARCLHSAVAYNGMVLAIGGKDDMNKPLKSIEKYNPKTGTWELFHPPLPEPRMSMGVATHDAMLWIAGGITSDRQVVSMLDSVWCLDHRVNRWTKITNLPYAVAFPKLLWCEGSLCCLGGAVRDESKGGKHDLESTNTVYNFEQGQWLKQMPMPEPCHNIVACNLGKRVYVFGAFRTQTMSQMESLFFFRPEVKMWETLASAPEEASGFMISATISQPLDET